MAGYIWVTHKNHITFWGKRSRTFSDRYFLIKLIKWVNEWAKSWRTGRPANHLLNMKICYYHSRTCLTAIANLSDNRSRRCVNYKRDNLCFILNAFGKKNIFGNPLIGIVKNSHFNAKQLTNQKNFFRLSRAVIWDQVLLLCNVDFFLFFPPFDVHVFCFSLLKIQIVEPSVGK